MTAGRNSGARLMILSPCEALPVIDDHVVPDWLARQLRQKV